MNPSQRGRMGAHSVHARGKTNTAPARSALQRKFELEVDPDGTLDPDELEKLVAHAKSLYYARISQQRWSSMPPSQSFSLMWLRPNTRALHPESCSLLRL
jgi:hypothetical protein